MGFYKQRSKLRHLYASLILEQLLDTLIDFKANIFLKLTFLKVYSAKNLLTYCEGFLLQNLVALLTYDDSVKRLIFGKKLQNHDVITGLLKTLQERVKKKGPSKSKKHSL